MNTRQTLVMGPYFCADKAELNHQIELMSELVLRVFSTVSSSRS